MYKKDNELANEFTTNSTSTFKDECEAVQQMEDEKLTQMELAQLQNNYFASPIQASERKPNSISDEVSSNEPVEKPGTALLVSTLSCSTHAVNLNKLASFKRRSNNSELSYGSKGSLHMGHNRTSNKAERMKKEITSESDISFVTHAASEGEFAGTSGYVNDKGNESRFVCNLCHKEFAESWEFDAHYRTHSDRKEFVCNMCQRIFSKKYKLDRHYRTHTGEKPFVCDICNTGFTQKGTLARHYISHSQEKPFLCQVCNRGFNNKGNLKIHYRTHTGEKPFMCDVCRKGFTQRHSLHTHYRKHC